MNFMDLASSPAATVAAPVYHAEPQGVAAAPYKVNTAKGVCVGTVSSQWFSRPDDQKFLSLDTLYASVKRRAELSHAVIVEPEKCRVEASMDNPDKLSLMLPGADKSCDPSHWSFGQLSTLVGAPAGYLRDLSAPIAAINLQYGLQNHRGAKIQALTTMGQDGEERTELRAATGADYGRIWDYELVHAVRQIAGNGTGDTRWKVPGMLNWQNGTYNPFVDISKETTTLYASDRDVFLFLVDDTHPIQAGVNADGSPDLYFRGFYCWNSETGSKALGIDTMYLRGVCQNRNLWGVENLQSLKIRHSKYAASRFAYEARPALEKFANSSPQHFIEGIKAARSTIVADSDEKRKEFLMKRDFSKSMTQNIIDTVLREEGRPATSIFDFVQGITAVARKIPHTDARLELERRSKSLFNAVAPAR